jgi:hypothetical protein
MSMDEDQTIILYSLSRRVNGLELSRPRVTTHHRQSKTRHKAKTGSNGALDQWVGSSDLLSGFSEPSR